MKDYSEKKSHFQFTSSEIHYKKERKKLNVTIEQ